MTKRTLWAGVADFINNYQGKEFKTSELVKAVDHLETKTRWKVMNSNPNYRVHTYKGYLGKVGILTNIERGVWRINCQIPEWFNLGTLDFLAGYGEYNKVTYNGLTKAEIREKLFRSIEEVKEVEVFDLIHSDIFPSDSKVEKVEVKESEIANAELFDLIEKAYYLVKGENPKDWDGETTQNFLWEIGMEGQMLKQLIMTFDRKIVDMFYAERIQLDLELNS